MNDLASLDDLELVNRSSSGDRDAFGEIVARYQSLVCALAYSATGSIGQSEDLAQEVFLAAWRQLSQLREPAKLRSWLCGITRNLVNNALRQQHREPVHGAESIDAAAMHPTPEPLPGDRAITNEEEALLWRAIERIPETYREPLVLFYRERQSVQAVAASLELSEDAAKQRLSRGRKLLQEELAAFVETTLARSVPGRAFTLGVLAALPAFAFSASAATVGATAAKGSAAASSASAAAIGAALIGPVVGLTGAYIGVKSSLNATRTPRERAFIKSQTKIVIAATLIFNVLIAAAILWVVPHFREHPLFYACLGVLIPLAFAGFIVVMALRSNRIFRELRAQEVQAHPEAFSKADLAATQWEYKSRMTFLGLPLIHCRSGWQLGGSPKPAVGWIAFGDKAYGILLAGGGVAVGGIAMGGLSVGAFALGGVSLGLFSFGGLALGGIAFGGGAIGIVAAGGFALGYIAAEGGLAVAQQFALGGAAFAEHFNDAAAQEFFQNWSALDIRDPKIRNLWTAVAWAPMLITVLRAWRLRRARKKG